jgi:hypothetical protein
VEPGRVGGLGVSQQQDASFQRRWPPGLSAGIGNEKLLGVAAGARVRALPGRVRLAA